MSADSQWESVARQGFCFFGSVCASVSHEIKNKLAVINEKAGLIEDLVRMLARGQQVDPQRLETQATKISEQVRQADQIVKSLNRFAHSVDEAYGRVEVVETIELVARLYARKAGVAGVRIDTSKLTGSVPLRTSLFLLEAVLFQCLETATARADDAKTITVTAQRVQSGAEIHFDGLAALGDSDQQYGGDQGTQALLGALGAKVHHQAGVTRIGLELSDLGNDQEGGLT